MCDILQYLKKHLAVILSILFVVLIIINLTILLFTHIRFTDSAVKYKPDLSVHIHSDCVTTKVENKTDKTLSNITVHVKLPFGYRVVDGQEIVLIGELESDETESVELKFEHGLHTFTDDVREYNYNSIVCVLFITLAGLCCLAYKTKPKNWVRVILLLCLFAGTRYLFMSRNPFYVGLVSEKSKINALGSAKVEVGYTVKSDNDFIDINKNNIPDCIESCDMLTDTDGDGLSDYEELAFTGTNPFSKYSTTEAEDSVIDSDGDGLINSLEIMLGSNPLVVDTDGDGLSDYEEYNLHTCPYKKDTDGDKMSDSFEVEHNLNPCTYTLHASVVYSEVDEETGLKVSVGASGNGDALARFRMTPVKNDINLSEDVPGYIGQAYSFGWEPENDFAILESDYGYSSYYDNTGRYTQPELLYKEDDEDTIFFPVTSMNYVNHVQAKYTHSGDYGIVNPFAWIWWEEDRTQKIHEPKVVVHDESDVKNLYNYGTFDYKFRGNAHLTFEFDKGLWEKEGFEPCIYHYDEDTQILTEVDTVVTKNKASATVDHFSTYVLLDKGSREAIEEFECKPAGEYSGVEVLLLLDTSRSTHGLDRTNNRLSFIERFIDCGLDKYKDLLAVTNFTGSQAEKVVFTSDFDYVVQRAEGILTGEEEKYNSDYFKAVNDAIGLFNADNTKQKFIILITDGFKYSYDNVLQDTVNKAIDNQVVIHTIDIGDGYDSDDLEELAYGTGGGYNHIADMMAVSNVEYIGELAANINYDTEKDSNTDGISDYYTNLINSGMLTTGTGYNFKGNFKENSADYDGDTLLNGDEIEVVEEDGKVYLRVYSDPFNKDTDGDGVNDNRDFSPLRKGLIGGIVGRLHIVSSISKDPKFLDYGHSFLVYDSYVNDTWEDTKDFIYWGTDIWPPEYNTLNCTRGNVMTVKPGDCVTIGNFTGDNMGAVLTGSYMNLTGSEDGINMNVELVYREKYIATEDDVDTIQHKLENMKQRGEYDKKDDRTKMLEAVVPKKLASSSYYITERGRNQLFSFLKSHNYYNLYSNNCVNVATGGMNASLEGVYAAGFRNYDEDRHVAFIQTFGRSKERLVHYLMPEDLYDDLWEDRGENLRIALYNYLLKVGAS